MSAKRTYFPFTSAQQRKLLFETWEATGKVPEACRVAHVGRGTFYYWKARFDEKGYAGLETFESRVAHKLNRKDRDLEKRVLELREEHQDWGKTRIANELTKEHNWVAVISPNTVRRILREAGKWSEAVGRKKKRVSPIGPPKNQDKLPT
jgi:transposase